ncbi:hypothetical protein GCM10023172_29420 [Hymenobacter ginsengisoli]|uniref:Outer membrane protein beta-barrel domain-containing protein n=1 Tax=Hymenobacter ginsengisoli TaxID=1051626 RepID=A0ABP8QIU6_9BACT|nr:MULTISPECIES: hypothetical protein [unclassified Hymenobacter]MBO2029801.1 hypothetical protein [Hymenobacter sp. BT559]
MAINSAASENPHDLHNKLHFAAGCARLAAFVLLPLGLAFGQQAPPSPAPAADAPPATHGSLAASLGYGSNSAFYGRTQSTPYPYLSAALAYTSKVGVWGSLQANNLLNTTAAVDEADLSVGWDGDLTKQLDASISYAHFFFPANSPLIKSSVANSLEGYLGYDWGFVYTRLNAAFLFGPDSRDGFLVLDNSRYIALKTFSKATLSTEPKLSITAGTQNFAETSVRQQTARGNNAKSHGKGGGGGNGGPPTTTTISTRFDVLAYELRLPLTYSQGKVAAEVAYRYLVPVNVLPDDDSTARSYVTATVSVTF